MIFLNVSESTDWMRTNGMIFVVVGVLLLILIGVFLYLGRIEKKIRNLERENNL